MVQVLQRSPSFGETFGAGFGQGMSRGTDFLIQMQMDKNKTKQRENLIKQIEQGFQKPAEPHNPELIKKQFIDSLPLIEEKLGRDLIPEELDQLWAAMNEPQQFSQQVNQDPFSKAKSYSIAGEPELARVSMEEAKLGEKMKMQERKESRELAKPTLERGRKLLEDLPYKENSLLSMEDAISSGNLGMFTLDNLAEMTGIEGLRSPEGAAFKTASKEFFLGNLSRIGARGLNQMMERVVQEMGPMIGRSTEANLSVIEILRAENDVTRKEAELINEKAQEFKQKHGHYPENLQHLVYKELRPYAEERQKEALANIDKIKSKYEPKNKQGVLMYDPAGNLRRVPHESRKAALKEGYRLP